MIKIKKILATGALILGLIGNMEVYAAETATFSQYWFQDSQGNWKVKDSNGNVIKNAWLCDDAVASNGKDVWYLLDSNGCMISAGLVQDQTGNFYSLETNHNGYFGMLRYKSGNYDGINLSLESSHGGAFAAVLNQDGLASLKAKYGVTSVNIDNSNCVYTSSFGSSSGGSSNTGSQQSIQNTQQQSQQQSTQNTQVDEDDPAELFRRISGGSTGGGHLDPSQIKGGDGTGLGTLH